METSVAAAIVGPHRLPPSAPANWVKADCEDLRLGLGAIKLGQMFWLTIATRCVEVRTVFTDRCPTTSWMIGPLPASRGAGNFDGTPDKNSRQTSKTCPKER
jgi:hypothetical protein